MKVLICPLSWGLGHASRIVPIIRRQNEAKNEVIIGADGSALAFLRKEFPALTFAVFPAFQNVKYSRRIPAWLAIFFQIPSLLKSIKLEHKFLHEFLQKNNIDLIISDNRYGLYSKKIKSVLISHQLSLKMPTYLFFFERIINLFLKRWIRNFAECWIPDNEEKPNFSGDLSHKYTLPSNAKFIGILSRFQAMQMPEKLKNTKFPNIIALVSGPEPHRTILEKKIISEFQNKETEILILRGLPDDNTQIQVSDNILLRNHLETDELFAALSCAKLVISRAGYSTIMDLLSTNNMAILLPTPGQTEQEYLVKYLKNHKNFKMCTMRMLSYRYILSVLNDCKKNVASFAS